MTARDETMTNRERNMDDDEYLAGRDAFECGATLRSVVARCDGAITPSEENDAFSFAIGFGDALLDRLRGIKRS